MECIERPGRDEWKALAGRPSRENTISERVEAIIASVRERGDSALFDFTREFDGIHIEKLAVQAREMAESEALVPKDLREAIRTAKANIETFHAAQRQTVVPIETMPGVLCWRRHVPIASVGLYIPGGSAPLFSTLLMLGVPARLAGCEQILVCTPPNSDGGVNPVVLYICRLLRITQVFKLGGAQAIAALAHGTESVPRVDKILGPGNRYVAAAKQQVAAEGVAVDLPAGPSELAVVADDSAVPEYVAADMLSQAEHGADSQTLLLATDRSVAQDVMAALEAQLRELPRRSIAEQAVNSSRCIIFDALDQALEFVDLYAPEHLVLAVRNPRAVAERVRNAGSVFLGPLSSVTCGDYASGTNHVLPTGGAARAFSGVSLDSFVKKITFQEIDEHGLRVVGPIVETLAAAEGLQAHREAVRVRLRSMGPRKNDRDGADD